MAPRSCFVAGFNVRVARGVRAQESRWPRRCCAMRARPGPRPRKPDDKENFFESEIVQKEAASIAHDHQELVKLGASYGKFDKRGKLLFIERWRDVMERYEIHLKRFELSSDFSAQMMIKQMEVQMQKAGVTRRDMLNLMKASLEKMEKDIEKEP